MTYEMFEGDSADKCGEKFLLMSMGGASGGSGLHKPGSEDPHQSEQKFSIKFLYSKLR